MLWEVIKVTWKKIFRTNTISVVIVSLYLLYCLYLIIPARNPEEGAKSLNFLFAYLAVLLSGGLVADEFETRQIDPFLSQFKVSSLFFGKLTAVVILVLSAFVLVGLAALSVLLLEKQWPAAGEVMKILGGGLVQSIYLSAAGFLLATRLRGVLNFAALLVIQVFTLYLSEEYFKMLELVSRGGLDRFNLKGAALIVLTPVWVRSVPWQVILLSAVSAGFIILAFLMFKSMARKNNLVLGNLESGRKLRLKVSGLKKTYREGFLGRRGKEVLKGVDFSIKAGKLTGFLGPNGAGKTTTLRIIMDFLKLQDGRVEYFPGKLEDGGGENPNIGYLQENASLYPFLTVRETFYFAARNGETSRQQAAELAVSLAEKLGLSEHLDRRIKILSKGTVQKVAFGVATVSQPEFLILDEPYTGLDPVIMYEIRNLILELKGRGTTIFLSSHLLPEVEKVCDEVVLINGGKIVCSGEIGKLKTAWRLFQAIKSNQALAVRVSQILDTDLSQISFGYLAGLEAGRLLEDEVVKSALKEIPVPDVEKIFLGSVMNS